MIAAERPPALAVDRVTFSYGSRRILDGVAFDVAAGETVALMGSSGSGKTTLLKVVAGLRAAEAGAVRVGLPGVPRRRGLVGYIPQQLGLVRNRSVLDNVLLGSLPRVGRLQGLLGAWPAREEEAARRILERVGLADKAATAVASLSGGERQRVAIARTVLQRPAVLLADEFTANLDIVKAGQILDLVREATARGVATVIALHNVQLAREYTDRAVFLRDGRVVRDLPSRELTNDLAREILV